MTPDRARVRLLRIPMRDGTELFAVLHRPMRGERFPVLLIRSPYSTQQPLYLEWVDRFVAAGYAVVQQDCRGRHESDGVWRPYVDEAADGFDTQQWIGAQPWCDGNIGTFGVSYPGFTQVQPAPLGSPYVKALVPIAHQEDNWGHLRCDGVLQLQNAMNFLGIGSRTLLVGLVDHTSLVDLDVYRRLPLVSALDDLVERPFYREMVRHSTFDDFWRSYSLKGRYPEIAVPAYCIGGWYDNLLHETFKVFTGWKAAAGTAEARRRTRLLVGPWTHSQLGSAAPFGDIAFGPAAAVDLVAEHVRWYDRRLRGADNGIDDEPPVRIFVMGRNVWRGEQEWPLARARFTDFYLHSGGRANSLFGDGVLAPDPPGDQPPDAFAYDPEDPVPTHGGPSMFLDNSGPRDRRPIERRDDVLVYTTPPLDRELEVTGPITLRLHAASTAPDTDFTATLVDVHPGGRAIHLCEGIARARYRASFENPTPIEPGRVYEYEISLWETSNVFLAGHAIRLEISSSNFPRFERNQNTGSVPGLDAAVRVAHQTIHHDARRPSRLVLPVIPA